ncbi:hypothetical protein [Deinococcus aquaticus]|uniref:ORC-CDC6 family AAA ATPase n=1 Tax=Deinococcus aquaticus TaxID=328692 RepID=UPI00360CBFF9
MENRDSEGRLSQAFTYKSEWLVKDAALLLKKPNYLSELELERPVIMTGSRGSGKTTAFLFLWHGNKAINIENLGSQRYFGLYHRIDTSVCYSFSGGNLPIEAWEKIFSHYINLIICDLIVEFVQSHEGVAVSEDHLSRASRILFGEDKIFDISSRIQEELTHLSDNVANISRSDFSGHLSALKTPIDIILDGISIKGSKNSIPFYFMFDEFENLLDYQQAILNTLLKHFTRSAYVKIGVRPLGRSAFNTINKNELLRSPDDFHSINVDDSVRKGYREFARSICNARLKYLGESYINSSIESLLEELSDEEEAKLLNVGKYNNPFFTHLELDDLSKIKGVPSLKIAFLRYWADGHNIKYDAIFDQYQRNKKMWDSRYANYKYAVLFAIGRGNRIRKYYCGWETIVILSHYNIRYLLEMIETMILFSASKEGRIEKIHPDIQTRAAMAIGEKNLHQIEGLSVYGRKIIKLMFGLGRIFEHLAAYPERRSPETNQFRVNDLQANSEAQKIIELAVQHSGIVRVNASKLTSIADTREYEYMLHPIFLPILYSLIEKREKSLLRQTISQKL